MNRAIEKKRQVLQILAREIQTLIAQAETDMEGLQEIRLRVGSPVILNVRGEEQIPKQKGRPHLVTKEEIRETVDYISSYSLYAFEEELRQGFLTVEGGHRVGMAGKVIMDQGKIKNIQHISSVNIRVAHEVKDCAGKVLPYLTYNKQLYHTLIISPPGCGKTTLLRDLIRQISDGNRWIKGASVGVVDERSELGACHLGIAQNELGIRTDILDGCPKSEGMIMLIRSMAPKILAVDEIGAPEDIHAIEYAMHCGCCMLATVHGTSMAEVQKKPVLQQLIQRRRFDRYVVLKNGIHIGEVEGIYDERGTLLYREQYERGACM